MSAEQEVKTGQQPYTLISPEDKKKYGYLLAQKYKQGTYAEPFENMRGTTSALINALAKEFTNLLQFNDQEVIRKATALKHVCPAEVPKNAKVDFKKITDLPSYTEEVVFNTLRIFGEDKHHTGYNFDVGSLLDVKLANKVLLQNQKINDLAKQAYDKYGTIYKQFIQVIEKNSGVRSIEFSGINFKPIQSMFNKMYARRGQAEMNVIGDAMRASLYVKTEEEVDKIMTIIKKMFAGNLAKKVEDIGELAPILTAIRSCQPLPVGDKGHNVIIYRCKPNSSQYERIKKGGKPHLININFFIDQPSAQISRHSLCVAGCELQIGVKTTLDGLRSNHTPYERQRILDGLPSIAFWLEGLKQKLASFFSSPVDYRKVNEMLLHYHAVAIKGKIQLNNTADMSYKPGKGPTMLCVNHGRINQWVRGAKWQEEHYDTMQVWEGRVNPEDQYLVHSLSVKIKDQGWGNIGVNIAFCAVVGGYLMEIASRALEEGERKMDSLWLVKDGFNFSRFMFNTFLPKGTTSVVLIAMGRLHNAGHEFHYGGHELTLAKIKQTSAEAIAH